MTGIPFDTLADLPAYVFNLYEQVLAEMYPSKEGGPPWQAT